MEKQKGRLTGGRKKTDWSRERNEGGMYVKKQ